MGFLGRARDVLSDVASDAIPGAELLDRKDYERARAKRPPEGWLTAEAVAERVQSEPTSLRVGKGNHGAPVSRARIVYAILTPDDEVRRLDYEGEIYDVPREGTRSTITYDPSSGELLLLENEDERRERSADDLRRTLRRGEQSPAAVVEAEPTGRRADIRRQPARELVLTLDVGEGGNGFRHVMRYWDVEAGVKAGDDGVLVFERDALDDAYAFFPSPEQRSRHGNDAAARAAADFIEQLG